MPFDNTTISDVGTNSFPPLDEYSGDIPSKSNDQVLKEVIRALVEIVAHKPENWDILVTDEILKLESIL
jgi:hypothetical protein